MPTPAFGGGGVSLGDLYSKCVQMVNENKISTKNAFDLHLIDHIDDIVDSFMGGRKKNSATSSGGRPSLGPAPGKEKDAEENRFHEASCTIEASARIYACRVDVVHTDTYRVLGGLNSTDLGDEDGKDGDERGGASKKRRICGVNTLERNETNIVQQSIEADEQSDPTFRRMAAAFDAGGAKGMLLSHLPIAEDLSLVFNGDVPLSRAAGAAVPMFFEQKLLSASAMGFGNPETASAKLANDRLCREVDKFRQLLHGHVHTGVSLPDRLETALGLAGAAEARTASAGDPIAPMSTAEGAAAPEPLMDFDQNHDAAGGLDDGFCADGEWPPERAEPQGHDNVPRAAEEQRDGPALPLANEPLQIGVESGEDVVAFDELFEKFCGKGGSHQFAYFDECWSKKGRDKEAVPIADKGADGTEGVSQEALETREKPQKRPLFDLSGLDKPAKPIETEPCHKHQLSERAAHWQLHKDVPPYMIDRITMPSWPTWSRYDFACLGLRPHLMLKLMRKAQPEGEGPHGFSELFSTVVVENPEAFPWLASEARKVAIAAAAGRLDRQDGNDDATPAEREVEYGDDAGDDDFDGNGLPAHLDVDPQDLFLQPGDAVLPGGDQDEADFEAGPGVDFDLVEQPATVSNVDISYSRNSKFVDVKLVKKHLWDCISDDIEQARAAKAKQATSSFQELVRRTLKKLPKADSANLSVAVCFICALHLCNEKGLELKTEPSRPLGDFTVVGSF